jgi:hypothetical protein
MGWWMGRWMDDGRMSSYQSFILVSSSPYVYLVVPMSI